MRLIPVRARETVEQLKVFSQRLRFMILSAMILSVISLEFFLYLGFSVPTLALHRFVVAGVVNIDYSMTCCRAEDKSATHRRLSRSHLLSVTDHADFRTSPSLVG